MICCVYVCMYGYEMVCISMHEYLLAPSKVWTVPQPISQPFEELQGWNSEFKLITPIQQFLNHGGHHGTMAAILNIQMSISQPFEELQGWNSEFKLFTTTYIISVLCKFVAPYWGVIWSVVCYYRYLWVWNGVYKHAWVFIIP